MVLELHIWGPAFGLPSIDAECIAATAYLNSTLEKIDWVLVAAHDPSSSPSKDFPALKDGPKWIAGFHAIVCHIKEKGIQKSDVGSSENLQQEADIAALSSLLECHGLPLLDLSLYTSSENYSSTTRPAFTRILPWSSNYIIPPARREAARTRTAHLGLKSLDTDTTHDGLDTGKLRPSERFEAEKKAAGLGNESRAESSSVLSFGRRNGLKGLLNTPQYAARFKLDALANNVLHPLNDLLDGKAFLLTADTVTSLDCLAFGYFALMLYPPVPQTWLQEAFHLRFPQLEAYTNRLRDSLLGGEVNISDLSSPSEVDASVPWTRSPSSTILSTTSTITHSIFSSLPLTSAFLNQPKIYHSTPTEPPSLASTLATNAFTLTAVLASVAAGVVYSQFGQLRRNEDMTFVHEDRKREKNLGEAGGFLAAFGQQLGFEERMRRERMQGGGFQERRERGPIVEVDVEVDRVQ